MEKKGQWFDLVSMYRQFGIGACIQLGLPDRSWINFSSNEHEKFYFLRLCIPD